MISGVLLLWMAIELCLTQTTSQTVTGFLGQSVQLPCSYSVSAQRTHTMCWGKGKCPNSHCNGEIIWTNGKQVTWSKSSKYELRGNIRRGDVTLTIKNTNEGDVGTYCCRIEVPGWFNDIKKDIVLHLERAPTTTTRPATTTHPTTTTHPATTHPGTTTHPTTTTHVSTTILPSTSTHLATTPLPTTTTHLTTTPLPATTTHLATACPTTIDTTAVQITTSVIRNLTTIMINHLTTVIFRSTTTALPQIAPTKEMIAATPTSLPLTEIASGTTETASFPPSDSELEEVKASGDPELLIIIVPLVGFVILLMLLAFLLRGKITRKNYLDTHKRLNNAGEVSSAFSTMPGGREEEEGFFTL